MYSNSNNNLSERFIILDTETTGLIGRTNHILEIAALEAEKGFLSGRTFHAFIKPRTAIQKEATEKHKITKEVYQEIHENNYDSEKILIKNLFDFIGDSHIIAHNSGFDMVMLNRELVRWDLPRIPESKFICTQKMFFKNFSEISQSEKAPKNNYFSEKKLSNRTSLTSCCNYFKIKFDENKLHSAEYDAVLTFKIFKNMLQDKKVFEDIEKVFSIVKKKNEEDINILLPDRNNSKNEFTENSSGIQKINNCDKYYASDLGQNICVNKTETVFETGLNFEFKNKTFQKIHDLETEIKYSQNNNSKVPNHNPNDTLLECFNKEIKNKSCYSMITKENEISTFENSEELNNQNFLRDEVQKPQNILLNRKNLLVKKKTNCVSGKSFLIIFEKITEDISNHEIIKSHLSQKSFLKEKQKKVNIFEYNQFLMIYLKFFVKKKLHRNHFKNLENFRLLEIIINK